MTTMRKRTALQAFPKPKWIDTVSCDGKPCASGGKGCGSDPATTQGGNCTSGSCGDSRSCDFATVLAAFAHQHRDTIDVTIADYSSLASILRSLEDLNRILASNGEELRVSVDNLELVFSQIAPIVAIDGTLAFVGKTPTEDELLETVALYGNGDHFTALVEQAT